MRRRRRAWPLAAALLLVAGCRQATPLPVVQPSPPPPPTLVSGDPLPASFETAESAFAAGDYATAGAGYDDYLSEHPDGVWADRALFRLALIATVGNPKADPLTARPRLQVLVDRFPASPYSLQARSLLALMAEIDRLRGEVRRQRGVADELKKSLDELKKIDLEGTGGKPRRQH
jgi:TolA-binding protein